MLADTSAWASVPVGQHLFLFSPILVLVATMLGIVSWPLVAGRGARSIVGVSILGLLVALVMAVRVAGVVSAGGVSGLSPQSTGGMLIADNLSVFYQILLLIFLGGITYLWWLGSAEAEENAPEFFILLLGSAVGMALMASTANLLMIVVAIEAASLPSYAIVGFDKSDRKGAEASLKYMVFGAVSAAIMLYGVSLIYGLVGSLSVADVARYTVDQWTAGPNRVLLSMGLLCLLAGIAFKISAVPFHFWCPDAFEGAKIEVTTWLSVASKAAGLVLLARLVMAFCAAVDVPLAMNVVDPLAWGLGVMAAVTCTVGNFAAYKQRSIKRLLAYSSIAHAGYMMMATAVFLHPRVTDSYSGLTALLAYLVIYLFMNLGAFGVASLVYWDTGRDDLEAFSGLMRRAPFLAVPMILCLMSLVGLPPLLGFWGKWWILVALGRMGGVLGWSLVIVAAVNTLISLYFYMRVVVAMTLRDGGEAEVRSPAGGTVLVGACGVLLLVTTLFPNPLWNTASRFSKGLYLPAVTARTAQDSATGAIGEAPAACLVSGGVSAATRGRVTAGDVQR